MVSTAFSLADHGDFEGSLDLSNRVIKECRNHEIKSMAYDNIGYVYQKKGDQSNTIQAFKSAVEYDSGNKEALYNLGVALYDSGRYDEAIVALNKIVLLSKSFFTAPAYNYLGMCQLELGELKNAENSFTKSLAIKDDSSSCFGLGDVYYTTQRYDLAAKYYEKGIEFEPSRPSNVKRLFDLGNAYYGCGKIESAISAYKRCAALYVKLWGTKPESLNDEVLIEMRNEHYMYSLQSSLMVARLSDNSSEIIATYSLLYNLYREEFLWQDYIRYAYALFNMGDTEKALDIVNKGIQAIPNNPELLFMKSGLCEGQEKIACLSKILEQEYFYNPKGFDIGTVYNNLAWEYHCLGESRKGLPYAEKAVLRNPEHDYSWETLGEIYYALGEYDKCIDAMTKCLDCEGDNQKKSAFTYRGNSFIKLGKKREGKNDLKEAEKYK